MTEAYLIGKIPPQSIDAEENLLGSILMSGENLDMIIDKFNPEMFYKEANKVIAQAVSEMVLANVRINLLTVQEKLSGKIDEIGGKEYLLNLINRVDILADLESLIEIIHEKYILRELINLSQNTIKEAFENTNSSDIISNLQNLAANLSGFKSDDVHHIQVGVKKLYDLIEKNIKHESHLTGMPSGLIDLDRFTNGFQKTDLIIIGGEPSNGKTSLALKIAKEAATFNHKTVIYSYEMSEIQLAARITAMETGLSAKKIQYRKVEDFEFEQINKGMQKIEGMELYIDNVQKSDLDYLEKSIRVMVLKEQAELVIIDYLQLIRNTIRGGNHAEEVADIANRLKGLAKMLDIPIILVSQLSRVQGNPKPTISRLKGSGDIEAAADVILLTWRPEFYDYVEFECAGQTYPAAGLVHLHIAKGRNIGTTEFVVKFTEQTTLFSDYERHLEGTIPY